MDRSLGCLPDRNLRSGAGRLGGGPDCRGPIPCASAAGSPFLGDGNRYGDRRGGAGDGPAGRAAGGIGRRRRRLCHGGRGSGRAGRCLPLSGWDPWIAAVTPDYRPDPTRRVSVFSALDPTQYVVYGTVQSAGSSVDWFLKAIGVGARAEGEDEFAALERLASSAPPGSRGLFFLPYLAGERSPIWDANARGVYFGLTAAHGRAEMARAVFEGVAYALASNLAVLEELGLAPERLRVLGGGMRSPLWRAIFAAVYNRPLRLLERLSEATSCG